ncbi:MAG: MFS transporter [Anaerolineae bacterium]|nr:MFS transporter [Anaerolineae bacterium]
MATHSLITTLKNLRGNVRGCVYTEPLWGIPFNLYAPYASVYMLSFGIADSQIGLITSIGLVFQIFWTVMSGAITDKLGRKRTTLIFDLVSWSMPCLILAFAQNVAYFAAAAIVNSMWRVVHNSWQCLVVEDTDPDLLVDVYSWLYIAGLLSAFVAPLTGLLIERFTLAPTVRGLYLLAFVMMAVKAFITNAMVTETRQGLVRMQETRHLSLLTVLGGSRKVLGQILHAPAALAAAGLLLILSIYRMIQGTFWSILATEKLLIPAEHLAYYTSARSAAMLLFFFLVMPRIRHADTRKTMLVGFLGLLISQVLLVGVPVGSYGLLLIATILDACSLPLASTMLEKLVVLTVDAQERSRIMAILYTLVIAFTSPFGWIAGQISDLDRSLPFVLLVVLMAIGGLLSYVAGRWVNPSKRA